MRTAYLDCFAGISGDMLLGALVDAGVPLSHLEEAASRLKVGAHLEARTVMRGGLSGTKVDVLTADGHAADHSHEHEHTHGHGHEHAHEHDHSHTHEHEHATHSHAAHRPLSAILKIIADADLADRVKQRAGRAFQLLGEAEAAIHQMPVDEVHFHEVGAVDTIVDIVCAVAGAEYLKIDHWISSPLNVGSGTVRCQHGTLPVPAPATLKLLADAPIYSAGAAMERVTPTGAAILRALDVKYLPLPAMRVAATGYGAGGRDTPGEPNLLRLLVGEDAQTEPEEKIAVIKAVIDDASPQLVAYASEQLLAAGAWDVYRTPVQMKKGRTGVELTVLCSLDLLPQLRETIFRETTTIGLRWNIEDKAALEREFVTVQTQWGAVPIKVARLTNGTVANAAPEFEDCRRLASANKVPLKQVWVAAIQAWNSYRQSGKEKN